MNIINDGPIPIRSIRSLGVRANGDRSDIAPHSSPLQSARQKANCMPLGSWKLSTPLRFLLRNMLVESVIIIFLYFLPMNIPNFDHFGR